ncbi:hypothetical protein L596_018554 [Steinernema carpocapsae]|uniref:Uncharacterized protein n=1 Tax=Steinernema carpocapsae TaxID=34508 RepID=A0A4U5N5E0_STECR|nr:hypothetical protein L596_018554 [Steinernema carpocapsae]
MATSNSVRITFPTDTFPTPSLSSPKNGYRSPNSLPPSAFSHPTLGSYLAARRNAPSLTEGHPGDKIRVFTRFR